MSQQSKSSGWSRPSGYVWALIGSAIGFANLLSFGTQCYRYGGGAFLIPFTAAMFMIGIPMLVLEGIVGQRTQRPLVEAYGQVAGRVGRFFGWLSVAAVTTIGAFYVVLTGWAVAYTYYAATSQIPEDTELFFTDSVLGVTGSLTDFGTLSWPILIATCGVLFFSWQVLVRNVRNGIEWWCSGFLPLLVSIVALFAVVVLFLPGAWDGIGYYLKPDWSKIADFHVWRDVFGQVFFSLSLGIGIVVGYSRHTGGETDIRRAMVQVALADFAVSFIAGLLTFGCIGYMSFQQQIPFDELVANASTFEVGYVIFPKILQTFGPLAAPLLGVLFFFSLFIAGITGVFSIIESCAGNIETELKKSRKFAVTAATVIIGAMAVPFCFGNGTSIIDALAPAVLGDNMLLGGMAQVIVFLWVSKELRDDPIWSRGTGRHPSFWVLRYLAIPLLGIILYASLHEAITGAWNLADVIRWGWFGVAAMGALWLARR